MLTYFALRRGHRYGTILIDIETGDAIDMLGDRTAEPFATWLRAHPGVEVICRDRGGSYAEGASRGAPDAVQVADRWHLVHNLSEAVERAVAPLRRHLQPPTDSIVEERPPPADTPIVQRTRARHALVHQLLAEGHGVYTIGRRLRLDPKTVRRYAEVASPDDLLDVGQSLRSSMLDPFKAHLLRRVEEGVTNTTVLHSEIKTRGYTGGSRTLRRWLVGVRGDQPLPPLPPPSTRDITGLIMRPSKKLSDDEHADLDRLCRQCEPLAAVRDLAFTTMVRNRTADAAHRLDAWIATAVKAAIAPIASFATGLTKDRDAVILGLSTPWSSGRVEGTVNKIKMLKRQMFGRANTGLLRKRVLLAI